MYYARRIFLSELRRLEMDHPGCEDSGWAVCRADGADETILYWYADRYVAAEEVERLNQEEES